MSRTLVTCYVNPDLDGVAGAIAYAEYLQKAGQNVVAGIIGQPHDEAKYILDRFGIPYPKMVSNADDFEKVILVDASDLNGLEGKISPEKVIEIFDHRKVHEADKFPNAKVQIELVGAAATLIAEKFMNNNVSISKESAILVCGAIISNTLNFKGTVTTDRDKVVAVWLNKTAKLSENFWKELFTAKSDLLGIKLAERIESDSAWFEIGKKKIGIAQIEIMGAKKLLLERQREIIELLNGFKVNNKLDHVFLNLLALDEDKNYFVTDEDWIMKLLESALEVEFDGNIGVKNGLTLRKQIVPMLKQELEK